MQPGDAVHQYAGFALTGTGEDQLTPQRRGYGLALGIVQGVQEEGEIVMHGAILAGNRVVPLVQRTDASDAGGKLNAWLGRRSGPPEPRMAAVGPSLNIRLIDTCVSSFTVFGRTGDDRTLASCHYRGVLQ